MNYDFKKTLFLGWVMVVSMDLVMMVMLSFDIPPLGPEQVPPHLVKVIMAPLALTGESYQYPPVNWASVLSPLMRLNFGKFFF